MSVLRWTRDGAALGVVLPALVFGAAVTLVAFLRATGPFDWRLLHLVGWLTVASTLFGAVGGGASGVATAWLDRRAPALAWFVGVPAGLVGGLVAVAALVGWMEYGVGVYSPRAAPFVFPTVAAVTSLTAPTHAAYLAIGRRGALAGGGARPGGGPGGDGLPAGVDRRDDGHRAARPPRPAALVVTTPPATPTRPAPRRR